MHLVVLPLSHTFRGALQWWNVVHIVVALRVWGLVMGRYFHASMALTHYSWIVVLCELHVLNRFLFNFCRRFKLGESHNWASLVHNLLPPHLFLVSLAPGPLFLGPCNHHLLKYLSSLLVVIRCIDFLFTPNFYLCLTNATRFQGFKRQIEKFACKCALSLLRELRLRPLFLRQGAIHGISA